MSESISLPALGESVTEGTVTRWLKNVGDRVEVDDLLLEISTDKVDTEIPSPVAGVIEEILVAEDATVAVGAALVIIGDGSGAVEASTVADNLPVGVGAVTLADPVAKSQLHQASPLRGTTVPMTRLRKVIAERSVASMTSMSQVTTVVEVDVTRVARLRDEVKVEFLRMTGNKLTFLPFFAMAAAEALRVYPIINSTVEGDSIVYPPHENMSIAVDTERGLMAPVIRDSAELDIAGLTAQIADLAERTRNNQLKPDELSGGTFTLTNTGSRGALFDTPVVFLPQSAILGTGMVVKRAVVVSDGGADAIAVRSMVYLALSYDHRIIDGADAARYLAAVKDRLEAGAFEQNLGI